MLGRLAHALSLGGASKVGGNRSGSHHTKAAREQRSRSPGRYAFHRGHHPGWRRHCQGGVRRSLGRSHRPLVEPTGAASPALSSIAGRGRCSPVFHRSTVLWLGVPHERSRPSARLAAAAAIPPPTRRTRGPQDSGGASASRSRCVNLFARTVERTPRAQAARLGRCEPKEGRPFPVGHRVRLAASQARADAVHRRCKAGRAGEGPFGGLLFLESGECPDKWQISGNSYGGLPSGADQFDSSTANESDPPSLLSVGRQGAYCGQRRRAGQGRKGPVEDRLPRI